LGIPFLGTIFWKLSQESSKNNFLAQIIFVHCFGDSTIIIQDHDRNFVALLDVIGFNALCATESLTRVIL
jgi:hypothetical protein